MSLSDSQKNWLANNVISMQVEGNVRCSSDVLSVESENFSDLKSYIEEMNTTNDKTLAFKYFAQYFSEDEFEDNGDIIETFIPRITYKLTFKDGSWIIVDDDGLGVELFDNEKNCELSTYFKENYMNIRDIFDWFYYNYSNKGSSFERTMDMGDVRWVLNTNADSKK